MKCPKCGRSADESAVICGGCDYILDVSFLFAEATDEWVTEEHAHGFEAERTQEVPDFLEPAGTDASLAAAFDEGMQLWSVATAEIRVPDPEALSPFEAPSPAAFSSVHVARPGSGGEVIALARDQSAPTVPIVQGPVAPSRPAPTLSTASEPAHTLETLSLKPADLLSSEQGSAVEDPASAELGADPVVLGNVSEDFDVFVARDTNWFLTASTQMVPRLVAAVPIYVSRSVRDMLRPDAVLAPVAGCTAELSHFESHVLQYLDGSRPVARVAKKCGLATQDLDIAISMLAEKNAISLVGHVQRPDAPEERAPSPSPSPPPSPPPTPTQVTRTLVTPLVGARAIAPGVPGVPGVPGASGSHARSSAPPSTARTASPTPTRPARPAFEVRDLPPPGPSPSPAASAPSSTPPSTPNPTPTPTPTPGPGSAAGAGLPPEIEWLRLSQQKEAEGDFAAAVVLLQRCVAKKPDVAAFHNRLGVLLAARLKDFDAAVPHLTRAVELQPDNETFRSNFGKIVAAAAAQPAI